MVGDKTYKYIDFLFLPRYNYAVWVLIFLFFKFCEPVTSRMSDILITILSVFFDNNLILPKCAYLYVVMLGLCIFLLTIEFFLFFRGVKVDDLIFVPPKSIRVIIRHFVISVVFFYAIYIGLIDWGEDCAMKRICSSYCKLNIKDTLYLMVIGFSATVPLRVLTAYVLTPVEAKNMEG